MTVRWLPKATEDLKRLYVFLHPKSPTAAVRVVTALVSAAESLDEFPEKGRPLIDGINYRELVVRHGSKGYVVRYRQAEGHVYIVRAWFAAEHR